MKILKSCLALWVCCLLSSAAFAIENPTVVTKRMLEGVFNAIQDDWEVYSHNRKKLLGLLMERKHNIDFTEMSKWIVGRTIWTQATLEQRTNLTQALETWLLNYYNDFFVEKIALLKDYQVEYLPLRHDYQTKKRVLVSLRLHLADNQTVNFDVRMLRHEQSWRIYDFAIEGISILAAARETFFEDTKRGGILGVTKKLDSLNKKYAD